MPARNTDGTIRNARSMPKARFQRHKLTAVGEDNARAIELATPATKLLNPATDLRCAALSFSGYFFRLLRQPVRDIARNHSQVCTSAAASTEGSGSSRLLKKEFDS
jgi:hypothetical protein